ncbi:hypothetical protein ACFX1X_042362 [Malus domestica]
MANQLETSTTSPESMPRMIAFMSSILERMQPLLPIDSFSFHHLLIISVLVSAKFMDDIATKDEETSSSVSSSSASYVFDVLGSSTSELWCCICRWATIISDKLTGRSKGYGFVTFKEPDEAKKACEDATTVISGRRANCNLVFLRGRYLRSALNTTPPPQRGSNGGRARFMSPAPTPASANHVQWYYLTPTNTPATPFHHQHHQAVPFYGYSSTYIATDMSYNHKVGCTGGAYINGHYSAPQVYPAQPMVGHNTLMPMYPLYYHHHHQSHTMGLHAHIYSPIMAGHVAAVPTIMSKPVSIAPNTAAKLSS